MALKGAGSGSGIDRNYSAGCGKTHNTGFDRYSGGGICQNLGTGCDIGKENGIRDGDDRRSGCGIIVKKERECRIRTPLTDPVYTV